VERGQLSSDFRNASTPGSEADDADRAGCSGLLLWNSNTGTAVGSLSIGSRAIKVVSDPSQGPLQCTGDPLDVALDGPGFLAVSTGLGVRYARDGELVIDGDGRLATGPGDLVLGTSGSHITLGQVSDPSQISIDLRGTVKVGTRTSARSR
jgi:flagellar basal body rod protein FlgG